MQAEDAAGVAALKPINNVLRSGAELLGKGGPQNEIRNFTYEKVRAGIMEALGLK